jgi:hypothetical protein
MCQENTVARDYLFTILSLGKQLRKRFLLRDVYRRRDVPTFSLLVA